jgi:hypothetical protein
VCFHIFTIPGPLIHVFFLLVNVVDLNLWVEFVE